MEEAFEIEQEADFEDLGLIEISDEEFDAGRTVNSYPELDKLRETPTTNFEDLNNMVIQVLNRRATQSYDDLLLRATKEFKLKGKDLTLQYVRYLLLSELNNHQKAVDNLFTMHGKEQVKASMKRFKAFLKRANIGFKNKTTYYSHRTGRSLSKTFTKHNINHLDLLKPYSAPNLHMSNLIYIIEQQK